MAYKLNNENDNKTAIKAGIKYFFMIITIVLFL